MAGSALMPDHNPFEFYPTPTPFTQWLSDEIEISGRCADVCVGNRAIPAALPKSLSWVTNDIDPRWPARYHLDASAPALYRGLGAVDWHITNPPFTLAIPILDHCVKHAHVGVAMYVRVSIHEVLKTGIRRSWMTEHPPTGLLFLPRFAYQRSPTTGAWATDSLTCCWAIWYRDPAVPQFIRYAPSWVGDALDAFTPDYRSQMDALMGHKEAA